MASKAKREKTQVRPGADAKAQYRIQKAANAPKGRHNQPRGTAGKARAKMTPLQQRNSGGEKESLKEMLF